ncbi:hypothetical protein D8I24_6880 (plasmid) [Cupriavidus necator H850]|nr:hypothetical protein D8I24_6880 [Cupriavidus necator H850]
MQADAKNSCQANARNYRRSPPMRDQPPPQDSGVQACYAPLSASNFLA